jgi:hypothetical protein
MSDLFAMSYLESQAELVERAPSDYPIGVESYYDGPAPMGGGMGGFTWFRSHDEAARCFVEVALKQQWLPLAELEGDTALLAKIESLLSAPFQGDADRKPKLDALNAELSGLVQVRFWGSLDELLAGDSAFAKEIRAWFRGPYDDEGDVADDSPIGAEERQEFIDELRNYGW